MDLFNPEKIFFRTLGFYQPFCTAMLHGKVETRWVREGRKPSTPMGWYLLYSTKKRCTPEDLFNWCGTKITHELYEAINNDPTKQYDGYAICVGRLAKVEILTPNHKNTFVRFVGEKTETIKGKSVAKVQWALSFDDIQPIEPFKFNFGKQGVGVLPKSEYEKIKILTPIKQ